MLFSAVHPSNAHDIAARIKEARIYNPSCYMARVHLVIWIYCPYTYSRYLALGLVIKSLSEGYRPTYGVLNFGEAFYTQAGVRDGCTGLHNIARAALRDFKLHSGYAAEMQNTVAMFLQIHPHHTIQIVIDLLR